MCVCWHRRRLGAHYVLSLRKYRPGWHFTANLMVGNRHEKQMSAPGWLSKQFFNESWCLGLVTWIFHLHRSRNVCICTNPSFLLIINNYRSSFIDDSVTKQHIVDICAHWCFKLNVFHNIKYIAPIIETKILKYLMLEQGTGT